MAGGVFFNVKVHIIELTWEMRAAKHTACSLMIKGLSFLDCQSQIGNKGDQWQYIYESPFAFKK